MNDVLGEDVLWEAVHAALDERRDPLADARVREQLADRPEDWVELLRLLERLERLPAPSRVSPGADRSRRLAACAGLLLALGLAWAAPRLPAGASGPAPGPGSDPWPDPRPVAVDPGHVHTWRITITHRTPSGSSRTVCEDGRVRFEGYTRLAEGTSVSLLHHPQPFPPHPRNRP